MPSDFRETTIWRSAFAEPRSDSSVDVQAFFRQSVETMRERVEPLVARIMRDMPGYTVHDMTHLDALWETASLVASEGLALNPPEAFVFAGAVLLHDAAMTLAAYPGGLAEVEATREWADVMALYTDPLRLGKLGMTEREIEIQVTTEVLRRLHGRQAAEVATRGWPVASSTEDNDGARNIERVYLIEDSDVRGFYGPTIGTVAASHWWPIAKVERELNRHLGGMTPKTQLSVDVLKIACLLRVADALHLDRRRAPPFVRAIDRPTGVSALHWAFQGKLAFPHLLGDAVVFTAGEPCRIEDENSWWLAFDAFGLADRELRDVELLLRDQGRSSLKARRVMGANDPEVLTRFVPVSGWKPVETRIRISDVPRIVETLGGASLYGDDATAPVRELIQNAMDAIQARRRLQDRPDWGLIRVDLFIRAGDIWLSIEDNGVGMSEAVLTGTLLDFGSSLWRSADVAEEFPNLAARGMNAAGRFGIGFFSIFMLGNEVQVTTRRYNRAESDALTLTFRAGLHSRPILSPAALESIPLDGGTRVEVKLAFDPRKDQLLQFVPKGGLRHRNIFEIMARPIAFQYMTYTLGGLVSQLAPASEISIDTLEFGRLTHAVSAGDWRTELPAVIGQRVAPTSKAADEAERKAVEKMIRPIVGSDGTVYGRAAIWSSPTISHPGVLTAAGLRVQSMAHILGIVIGDVDTAARDQGRMSVDTTALMMWATDQSRLLEESEISADHKAMHAEIILECGGTIGDLPIARRGGEWLTVGHLRALIETKQEIAIHVGEIGHEDYDPIGKNDFEQTFEPSKDLLFFPKATGIFVYDDGQDRYGRPSFLLKFFEGLLRESWGAFEEYDDDEYIAGTAYNNEINRSVVVYSLRDAGR